MPVKESPSLSVVCVHNDPHVLATHLAASLEVQTLQPERILLDNREGTYRSAAEALNAGARQATGDYILFAHQDVAFPTPDWLARAATILPTVQDLGVAGCAGVTRSGAGLKERGRGEVWTHGVPWAWSHPVTSATPVQTLDECLLITSRGFIREHPFDEETFDGWHLYGADLCLRAADLGLAVVVLPLPLIHDSHGTPKGLLRYQWRLAEKHGARHPEIATSLGVIPAGRARRLLRVDVLRNLHHRLVAKR